MFSTAMTKGATMLTEVDSLPTSQGVRICHPSSKLMVARENGGRVV
jgi:hypothetical protein